MFALHVAISLSNVTSVVIMATKPSRTAVTILEGLVIGALLKWRFVGGYG